MTAAGYFKTICAWFSALNQSKDYVMILQGDDGIGIVISDSFRIGGWTQTIPKAQFLKAGSKAALDCFLPIINST